MTLKRAGEDCIRSKSIGTLEKISDSIVLEAKSRMNQNCTSHTGIITNFQRQIRIFFQQQLCQHRQLMSHQDDKFSL
jgi:hypothetical protein